MSDSERAIPRVPVIVLTGFRWRKVWYQEGDRVLLTRRTARVLLEQGAIKTNDGTMDTLYPMRRFRCSVVRAGGAI